jgi:hypothetical protein
MLFAQISEALGGLRPSERKVGEFVLARPTIAAELTIADLAAEVGVSEPTVIRFCRAIGLKGFQDLKRKALRDIERRKSVTAPSTIKAPPASGQSQSRGQLHIPPVALVAEVILRQRGIEVMALEAEYEPLANAVGAHLAAILKQAPGGKVSGTSACLELGEFGPGQIARLVGAPAASGLEKKTTILLSPPGADLFARFKQIIAFVDDLSDHLSSAAGASLNRQAEREGAFARSRAQAMLSFPRHLLGGPGATRPDTPIRLDTNPKPG